MYHERWGELIPRQAAERARTSATSLPGTNTLPARRAHPERSVVVDIEAAGPSPGWRSLLSICAVACPPEGDAPGSRYANHEARPGAAPHPETQRFWDQNSEAWALARAEPLLPPAEAMTLCHG